MKKKKRLAGSTKTPLSSSSSLAHSASGNIFEAMAMANSYDLETGGISSSTPHINLRRFSPAVQNHLKQVYLTLCCTLLVAAFGAYVHMLWNIGGVVTSLGFAAGVYCLYCSAPYQQSSKRLSILLQVAFLKGASDGPIFKLAIGIDSSLLITAFVGMALAFVCFSAAAMLTRRREYFYLGGLLSSATSISVWLELAFFFSRSSASIFEFESHLLLYVLLLIFLGYIVMDTHEVIEKASGGDLDYVKHSLTFFTAVFARILNIMMKNFAYKQEKEEGSKEETETNKFL